MFTGIASKRMPYYAFSYITVSNNPVKPQTGYGIKLEISIT